MKRIIYGSLGVLGIGVIIALLIPSFWDIDTYKPQILAKAKEILKREVHIDGKLSFSLLPSPRISATQVRVGNLPGSSAPDFLRLKHLQISFNLLPLLKKQFEIKTITLDHPEVFLEKLQNGQANWDFMPFEETSLPSAQDKHPVSQRSQIVLDNIEIKKGYISYHQAEKNIEVREIDLTAKLDLSQGSYTAAGRFNAFGQDMNLESHVRTIGTAQEVNLKMQAGGIIAVLKGQALLSLLKFKGTLEATAYPDTFKKLLPVNLPLVLTTPLQLNATVVADPDRISFTPITIHTDSMHPTGDVEIFLKNGLRIESIFKNLPGRSYCQLALSETSKGLTGNAKARVGNTKDLLNSLSIETKTIPAGLLEDLTFSTQYQYRNASGISLENMDLTIKDAKLRGNVSWQMVKDFSLVGIDMESPHTDAIFKLLNIKVPQIFKTGHGRAWGKISGNMNTLKLDTKVSLGELALNLKGVVASWLKTPELDLYMGVSHPNFKRLMGNSSKRNSTPRSGGRLSIDWHVQGNKTYLKIPNLKGKLGPDIHFSGNLIVDSTGTKPNIKASFSSDTLNADILLATAIQEKRYQSFPNAGLYLIAARGRKADFHPQPKWSREPLDFSFLSLFDGQLDLSTQKLIKKDITISHPKLMAKVQNGRLDFALLEGSIFGGELKGNGYLTADNTLHFNTTVKNANLNNLFTSPGKIKIVEGKMSFSGNFLTHGHSMEEMVQHLTGPVSIQANDGVISGFDLSAISHRLANTKNLESLVGLLSTATKQGKTSFSSFKGDIAFKEGVGTIQTMTLIAKSGQGHATGYINLPLYTLDIHTEFHLTEHPNFPPFRMRLVGDLDNPSRKLDTAALEKYMVENIFKNVIQQLGKGKLNVPDIFGRILGRRG